jgi:vitamin B12 transporter
MNKSIRLRARAIARFSAPVLSVLSLAVAASVQAQGLEINPVVVSATRMEQPLSEVLSSVSVITRADIDKSQAANLADLLQGEAGFEFDAMAVQERQLHFSCEVKKARACLC